MHAMRSLFLAGCLLFSGCATRNDSKSSPEMKKEMDFPKASIEIKESNVKQIIRVIGIEKDEASCLGGTPKHSFDVAPGQQLVFEVPISVTKIGLCGQPRPDGMDYEHIDVALEEGASYTIVGNTIEKNPPKIAPGFARVQIEKTTVEQIIRVIGIENKEASCAGGNPKHSFDVPPGSPMVFDFPIAVTKIGLCGQARPDGRDFEHLDVSLEEGATYTVNGKSVEKKEAKVEPGFARIRVQKTGVAQLIRVIGVEKNEASCLGGSAKYSFDVPPGAQRVFDFPIAVTKLGLCGQARPDGVDFEHISVSLKSGSSYIIDGTTVTEEESDQ